MEKICRNCRYCERCYYKGYIGFYRDKVGFCSLNKTVTEYEGRCGRHRFRGGKARTVSVENLDNAISCAEELLQIFYGFDGRAGGL